MALTNVAQIHRKQGKYDESLHFSTKAIEVNPKLAAAHFEKGKKKNKIISVGGIYIPFSGISLLKMGRNSAALECLNKAVELNPKFTEAHKQRAVLMR